jgi:hypothetical protein
MIPKMNKISFLALLAVPLWPQQMHLQVAPRITAVRPVLEDALRPTSLSPVRYELSFPNAIHHEAEISVTFHDVRQTVLEVVMSRSSPGRYALHEFAKNVYQVRAMDGEGHSLKIERASPLSGMFPGTMALSCSAIRFLAIAPTAPMRRSIPRMHT